MTVVSDHLLSAILLTPLAGAVVVLFVGETREQAIRWIAGVFSAAGFLLALPLWFRYEPLGKTWQFAERGPSIASIGASYYVGVDGFSITLILLTTLMGSLAIAAAWNDGRTKGFYALMLVLEAGLAGAFAALDFLLLFLCWQAVLVSMSCLIALRGARSSARVFFLCNLASGVLVLAGVFTLYFQNHAATGAYSFDITQYHVLTVSLTVQRWVFIAFVAGFALLVPMFPVHAWFPRALSDAPVAGAIMLAAVLLKMGTYGFIRIGLPILPDASRSFAPAIAVLSIAGMIYGAVIALAQSDWKRILAYASVSQMALVMLGMLTLTPDGLTGSLVQQISHGLSTGALLIVAGLLEQRRRTTEVADYGGLARTTPRLATVFLVVTLSAIGVPALSGFIGQRLIVQGTYAVSRLWTAAAVVGVVLAAVCLLKLYRRTMLGRLDNPANAALRDLTAGEVAIFAPVVALAFWIGLNPGPLLRRLETSVGRVVARANPVYAPYVAQGSDCATPAAPAPAGPPPAFVLAEPCADGADATAKPKPESDR